MKRKKFLPYRRKREGKTNYRKRLGMLKSQSLRLVVRKSLRNVTAQIIEYHPDGDKTIVSVSSKDLKNHGWKQYGRNTPAAYLVGLLCGVRAKEKKIENAILDIGLNTAKKGTIVFSVLRGVVDAGLDVPHDAAIFPKEDRIRGAHISEEVTKQLESAKQSIQKGMKE